jgi:hypothetical protein
MLIVPQDASIGSAIESILLLWIASGADEWKDSIVWLPLSADLRISQQTLYPQNLLGLLLSFLARAQAALGGGLHITMRDKGFTTAGLGVARACPLPRTASICSKCTDATIICT